MCINLLVGIAAHIHIYMMTTNLKILQKHKHAYKSTDGCEGHFWEGDCLGLIPEA